VETAHRPRPAGSAELRAAITTEEPDPANVCVAVEINHRLIVGALVVAGYVVDPINPEAAERFRDRRKPSGGKNDRLDAEVLASSVAPHPGLWSSIAGTATGATTTTSRCARSETLCSSCSSISGAADSYTTSPFTLRISAGPRDAL
jgi:hypothetical protein